MAVDAGHSVGLEIGHVLFIDIVGYSKLLSNGVLELSLKDWNWDPLRNRPRFPKLLNGPPPKIVYH
jgi:hypothetical protein